MRAVLVLALLAVGAGCDGSPVQPQDITPQPSGPLTSPIASVRDSTEITPLPANRIQELFDRIGRDEDIPLAHVYQALVGPQFALRADAARYLGTHGDHTSIPHLINALGDDSEHVGDRYADPGMATTRYWANDSLKRLTGEDFGFVWNDPKRLREAAISRWRAWYAETYE